MDSAWGHEDVIVQCFYQHKTSALTLHPIPPLNSLIFFFLSLLLFILEFTVFFRCGFPTSPDKLSAVMSSSSASRLSDQRRVRLLADTTMAQMIHRLYTESVHKSFGYRSASNPRVRRHDRYRRTGRTCRFDSCLPLPLSDNVTTLTR